MARRAVAGHIGGLLQQETSRDAHLVMQVFHGADLLAQRRRLAHHVEAARYLFGFGDACQAARGTFMADDALRGQAQPADVQRFQSHAELVGGNSFSARPGFHRGEGGRVRRGGTPDDVTRPGFEKHGMAATHRLPLEGFPDRAGGYGFPGEQVWCAHEEPDFNPVLRQRRHGDRSHGPAGRVVDTPRQEDVARGQFVRSQGFQKDLRRLLPEDEAGQRTDVTSAFAPFKHEAARAFPGKEFQEFRRGDVQVGPDSLLLETEGLTGTASRDEGEGRVVSPHHGHLLFVKRCFEKPK